MKTTITFAAKLASLSLLAGASAMLLAAAPAADTANQDMKALKGAIKVDGSSTVYPITEAIAEEFNKVASKVRVTVGISGTGGGFKRFCAGEIDISDASRPIKKSEADGAGKASVEFVELPIAYDGLTIVVNPKNTWCTSLTVDQIKKIYSASGGVKTWKDIDPSWPEKAIKVYSPGTDSGTFDYFKEVTVGKDGSIRSDMSVSEDDNVLVRGVSGDEAAIGFFGCAYYFENKDKVKAIAVDGGKGAVPVSVESIENGSYAPFSRPLFIYVNKKSAERAEVDAFVDFYLKNAATLVGEVGYVKLPEAIYAKVGKNWDDRRTGTQFSDAEGKAVTGSLADIYK
ncbi:MAG: PstS family phosphate ABC transporter substrate-binding protein [Phycisphaerales bacterium]